MTLSVIDKGELKTLEDKLSVISLMVEDILVDNDISKGHKSALSTIMVQVADMCQVLGIPIPASFWGDVHLASDMPPLTEDGN